MEWQCGATVAGGTSMGKLLRKFKLNLLTTPIWTWLRYYLTDLFEHMRVYLLPLGDSFRKIHLQGEVEFA